MGSDMIDVGGYEISRARWARVLDEAQAQLREDGIVGVCAAIKDAARELGLIGDRLGCPFETGADVYDALGKWSMLQQFAPPLSGLYWFPTGSDRTPAAVANAAAYRRTALGFMAARVRGGE